MRVRKTEAKGSGGQSEVYTEPWIYWLEAAGIHLERTRECREISISGIPIGPRLIEATLAELPAAMQTIAAAAFAVDGFDGAVGDAVSLPDGGRPRARAIHRRMTSVLELDDPAGHERELFWLFEIRNRAVHAGVWKESGWLHPSGLTVSRTQEEIGLENAERAIGTSRRFIRACLQADNADDVLGSWATIRRGRCEELFGGPLA
jgi:hypothetical protein